MNLGNTIVIGDVHGMYDELNHLLDAVGYQQGVDQLVMAGDVIHKGPKQAEVVRLLFDIGAEMVLGNHEEKQNRFRHTLDHVSRKSALRIKGAKEMLALEDGIDDAHRLWMESAHLFAQVPGGVVVHAGIPGWLSRIPTDAMVWLMSKKERSKLNQVLRIRHVRGTSRTTLQVRLEYSGHMLTPERIDEMLERDFIAQLAAASESHELVKVVHRHRGEFISLGKETEEDPFWTELYDGRFGHVYYGHQPWLGTTRPRATTWTSGMDLGAVFGGRLAAAILPRDEGDIIEYHTVEAGEKYANGLWD